MEYGSDSRHPLSSNAALTARRSHHRNPKTALFFLAFLPQFVDPDRGPVWAQTLLLGGTFVAIGLVTDTAYAFMASAAAHRLRSSGLFARVRTRAAGLIYIALGASALLTSRADARAAGLAAE